MSLGSQERTAVILMAYGGPESLDDVGPFMAELIRREPPEAMLERVKARYARIGGASPLPRIASDIASRLEERLSALCEGTVPVRVGFRYTDPRIAATLRDLYDEGVRQVAAVSLSPFESETTSVAYARAVEEALTDLPGMEVVDVPMLSTLDAFRAFLARAANDVLSAAHPGDATATLLVLTAHSLPVPDLTTPDPYCDGLRSVADHIADKLGLGAGDDLGGAEVLPGIDAFGSVSDRGSWILGYQSRGQRPCEWLGPELEDVMRSAAEAGFSKVVVQPIGFATDHMETLYDIDVEAADRAAELGIEFARGGVPNADPSLIDGLAEAVLDALGAATAGSR